MSKNDLRFASLVISVQKAGAPVGRTALMKFTYFAQTIRCVPLEYQFKLYTYGPYESQVLEDLKICEGWNLVTSKVVTYPSGYGYEIIPGESAESYIQNCTELLQPHEESINWVMQFFGAGLLSIWRCPAHLFLWIGPQLQRKMRFRSVCWRSGCRQSSPG